MHRIDTPTAQKDKFGAGKNGFTRGNPQTGTPATDLDDDYFDMLQEELAGVVEAAGIALDKTKKNQLLLALKGIFPERTSFGISLQMPGWAALPSGLHIRWGNTPAGSTTRPVTFATPFPVGVLVLTHFDAGWHTSAPGWGATDRTKTGFTGVTTVANEGGQYIALGY